VFAPDYGVVSDAGSALEALVTEALVRQEALRLPSYDVWAKDCALRKATMQRKTHFDNVPIKPQRVYEEMNRVFGRDAVYVSAIGLSQIAGAQLLHVYKPRHWVNCGQAGPLGWTMPAAMGVAVARPDATVVALSGDYDFQFLIEELASAAQHRIGYVHVLVNNSYLGLIRQAQRGFEMDFHVSLGFENVNSPHLEEYGVDHVKVVEGLGCKAIRVREPDDLGAALQAAQEHARSQRLPVVVEVLLEKVTNISMGNAGLDAVNEFEELAVVGADAPTAISVMD
jgi:tartronate-semialdehyde synthase